MSSNPPNLLLRCGGHHAGLHANMNPAASACPTPATSVAGQPEVARKRERSPDVAMVKPIKANELGKPLDCCNVMVGK